MPQPPTRKLGAFAALAILNSLALPPTFEGSLHKGGLFDRKAKRKMNKAIRAAKKRNRKRQK